MRQLVHVVAAMSVCVLVVALSGTSVHADAWPEEGPKREGQALVFPHHNLRWTLPADRHWKWQAPIRKESKPSGELVRCVTSTKEHRLWCSLQVTAEKYWADVERVVRDPKFVESLGQGMLESADPARTRSEVGVKLGNVRGGGVHVYGTFEGEPAVWSRYETYVHGERFTWQVIVGGPEDCESACAELVRELLDGLEFQDTTPWMVGPCSIEGTYTTDRPQAKDRSEETQVKGDGFKATKPAAMNSVPVNRGQSGASLRFAWEARSEDQRAYLYFDLRSVTTKEVRHVKDYPRRQMGLRADHWKEKVADAALTPRGGDMTFKTKWGRTRCQGYEFRGTVNHEPFTELGYFFKKKKHWFWMRVQYGGQDAQQQMADLAKTLTRCVKL